MFEKIIAEIKNGKNIILLHSLADIDAIGSAIALKGCFPNLSIGIAENISKIAKKLAENLKEEYIINPEIANYEKVIILDTSNPSQILPLKVENPIVIDHHQETNSWQSSLIYIDSKKSSCAEIVYEILKEVNFQLTKKSAIALLCGILTDSGRFRYGNAQTLKTFAEIMENANVKIEEVISLIEDEEDISQKIANIKALQRVSFENYKNCIIAITHVSAFESSVAKIILMAGADVVFVGNQKGKEFMLIAKTKNHFAEKINLGKLMDEVGKEVNAGGGGHIGAGGLSGAGDVSAILKICVEKVKEKLR